jgi:hypothetical protein
MFFSLIGKEEIREDDSLKKILLRIAPTNRVYCQVAVRGEEEETVKLWSIPPGGFRNLKTECDTQVEFEINVANPQSGKDLVITMTRLPMGAPYLKSVSAAPTQSEVGFDWQSQAKDIEAAAHQREFSAEDVLEMIPDELGEFYETLTELQEKHSGKTKGEKFVEGLDKV